MVGSKQEPVDVESFRSGDPNEDLDALVKIANQYSIKYLQRIINENDDDIEGLVSHFGIDALRFSVILDIEAYDRLSGLLDSKHQEILEKNYENLKSAIKSISEKTCIERIFHSDDGGAPNTSIDASLNQINRIEPKSAWFFDRGGVDPRIRFIFANYKFQQVLLDTTLDWDDIVFVASKLVEALRDDINRTEAFLDSKHKAYAQGALKTDNFRKNFEDLQNALRDIKNAGDM